MSYLIKSEFMYSSANFSHSPLEFSNSILYPLDPWLAERRTQPLNIKNEATPISDVTYFFVAFVKLFNYLSLLSLSIRSVDT